MLWHNLGQELLYENVWVRDNERWPSLHNGLQRTQNARRVRGVRLSSTRPDHNVWVLQRCPHIHVLVLPEAQGRDGDSGTGVPFLPALPLLKHLYWAETSFGAALLPAVLTAAPNVEQISLARKVKTPRFNAQRIDRSAAFPPLPCLTHLTISRASLHETPNRPLFPTLRVLALVTDPAERVSFPAILHHFPALSELRYDASNPPLIQSSGPLAAKLAPLEDLTPAGAAHKNAKLLMNPMFPALQRIVLDGPGWGGYVNGTEWAGLRARGCLVEDGVQ
ncbi:hypothetical protein C8R47DRAFT_1221222 [Mycena vitilis]|nr:hypothetical protein C8R47DRAFT_1224047 [Mycena vitilis]KAJ6474506.1 hypothetical protein C8R47DRAFT_1221222 [Mycena vitilis]